MRIHFISGLPRSGSTLLSGILRQNPRFRAGITNPLADLFGYLVKGMSGFHDTSIFISDEQRRRVLRGLVESYYADAGPDQIIFDTNRAWTLFLAAIAELFPESRVICCVRNPAWILDSIESHVQRNPLTTPKMFTWDSKSNVYTRVESLMAKDGLLKRSLSGLRQAWFGPFASRLVAVRYESLASDPAATIGELYKVLRLPPTDHNFDSVEYDEPKYDESIGLPGFHRISGPVRRNVRDTILPPDVFKQYDDCFWDRPGQNPRGIEIL